MFRDHLRIIKFYSAAFPISCQHLNDLVARPVAVDENLRKARKTRGLGNELPVKSQRFGLQHDVEQFAAKHVESLFDIIRQRLGELQRPYRVRHKAFDRPDKQRRLVCVARVNKALGDPGLP